MIIRNGVIRCVTPREKEKPNGAARKKDDNVSKKRTRKKVD